MKYLLGGVLILVLTSCASTPRDSEANRPPAAAVDPREPWGPLAQDLSLDLWNFDKEALEQKLSSQVEAGKIRGALVVSEDLVFCQVGASAGSEEAPGKTLELDLTYHEKKIGTLVLQF